MNAGPSRLIDWFARRIGVREPGGAWVAKPEYVGSGGRNDWRLLIDHIQIVVEAKFGDGIDVHEDCLKYLATGETSRLVIVASLSEYSELSQALLAGKPVCADFKESLVTGKTKLLSWHELVSEAARRLPSEMAAILLKWGHSVQRRGLSLFPGNEISGAEIEQILLRGGQLPFAIMHTSDARSTRRSTIDFAELLRTTRTPEWACGFLREIQSWCSSHHWTFEPKARGWVNIRFESRPSMTLIPRDVGIILVVSHPPRDFTSDGLVPLSELKTAHGIPMNANWFPRDRAVGLEVVRPTDLGRLREILGTVANLLGYRLYAT